MPDKSLHIDRALLLQVSEGDEKAFEIIFHSYVPQILPLILDIIGKEEAVKDVVQDIFLKVWINRSGLPEIKDFRAWFFTLVYHQSYSWLRYEGVRDKAIDNFRQQPSDVFRNAIDEYAAFRETGRLIREAISCLTGQQQKIYRMSREQHKTIPEIAIMLNLSQSTVKNTLVSALKSIRAYLEREGIIIPMVLLMISM